MSRRKSDRERRLKMPKRHERARAKRYRAHRRNKVARRPKDRFK